jgi:small subunit ribosomal protein S20
MANTKSAQKNARKNEKRRVINLARKTTVKTSIKKVLIALEENESAEKIQALLRDAQAELARAKNKHLIHANNAARRVSRLALKVNAAAQQAEK